VLDFAKVGEQLARHGDELLKAVTQRAVVEHRHVARQHARDLGIDVVTAALQLGDARLRVGFAAFAHLLEQLEEGEQARLGADEAARGKRIEPGDGLLGGRREVEMRFVRALRVELAQPALVVGRPVVEVVERRFREQLGAAAIAQRKQLVFQRFGQIRLCHHPHIRSDEHALQEARHQRSVIRTQQPPGRMILAQQVEGGVVEAHQRKPLATEQLGQPRGDKSLLAGMRQRRLGQVRHSQVARRSSLQCSG
jgi:hypothetical protein